MGGFQLGASHAQNGPMGNWLFLEYGGPLSQGQNVRFLLGVWAPHSVAQLSPPVVLFLTPNTFGGNKGLAYPIDRFPFTGVYPYGLLPDELPSPGATVPFANTQRARDRDTPLAGAVTRTG
jgi:hypothetical protein